MAEPTGEEAAVVLLRALPGDVAGQILARLDAEAAGRLRARIAAAPGPPAPDELDAALDAFFDLQRIASRPPPPAPEPATAAEPAGGPDPVRELRTMPPEQLARALADEPALAVALILSRLEPAVAAEVMKRLPPAARAEAALRLAQPGTCTPVLLTELARAVVAKGRRLAETPPEPTPEERVKALAAMLRGLPRPDRVAVLETVGGSDPALAQRVRASLYSFEDVARIDDRTLRGILAEVDIKTLAVALKGAAPAVATKVMSNISTRARDELSEETELLGQVSESRVKEAREKVVSILCRYDEAGKIEIGS